jgi:hypothetical protein
MWIEAGSVFILSRGSARMPIADVLVSALKPRSLRVCSAALAAGLALGSAAARAEGDDEGIQFAQDDDEERPAAAATPAPDAAATPADAPAAAKPDETPTETPAEATPAPGALTEEPGVQPTTRSRRPPRNERMFGRYRIRVAGQRPKFDDGMEHYDELYGRPSIYPTFSADWFPLDWYATLGLTFHFGYYVADGHAAKNDTSPLEKDPNGQTTLTLIPLQIAAAAEFTPFTKKYVVIDAWLGVERLYWQEVRKSASSDASSGGTSGTSTPTTSAMAFAAGDSNSDDSLTNKGWKNATVVGVSANILLNAIDEETTRSMRSSMGLGSIYLSPFLEVVRQTSKSGISFGRSSFGVGFTFESVN